MALMKLVTAMIFLGINAVMNALTMVHRLINSGGINLQVVTYPENPYPLNEGGGAQKSTIRQVLLATPPP